MVQSSYRWSPLQLHHKIENKNPWKKHPILESGYETHTFQAHPPDLICVNFFGFVSNLSHPLTQQMGTQVEQLWISIWDLWEQQWEQMWLQIPNLLGYYWKLQKLLIKSHGKKYLKILQILLEVDNLFYLICIIAFTYRFNFNFTLIFLKKFKK
jgi:hypothetical protein